MSRKTLGGIFAHQGLLALVIYVAVTLLFFFLQTAPHGFLPVYGARPEPLILLTVGVAVMEGAKAGGFIGFLAGLLWDVYSLRLFGFQALMLLLIGVTAGLLIEWLLRTNFLSMLLLCGGAVLLHTVLDWFLCNVIFVKEDALTMLWRIYLPNALYTFLLTPLVYWLTRWLARCLRRRERD